MAEPWKLWDIVCNSNCYVFVFAFIFLFVSFGINLENYHLTRANLSKLWDVVKKREQNDGKNVHPATKQLEIFFLFCTIATWGWISDCQNCDLIFDIWVIFVIFVRLMHYLGSCKKYANKCVTSQQNAQNRPNFRIFCAINYGGLKKYASDRSD